jgi:hypothetical protein
MKRLKLKCIQEKPQQHNNPDDYVERFNRELENYCKSPKSKEVIICYKWYHTDNVWPPDINEDIVIFNENGNYEISRSFSTLQNLIYRIKVMGIKDRVRFYWMRIKTPTGEPQYADR